MPSARQYMKTLLRWCVVCRKHSGKPYIASNPTPPLKVRIQDVHLFTIIRVNFNGSCTSTTEERKVKYMYVCLLVPPVRPYIWRYHRPISGGIYTNVSLFCWAQVNTLADDFWQCHHLSVSCWRAENSVFIRGSESSTKPWRNDWEVHIKKGSIIWRLLGAPIWLH